VSGRGQYGGRDQKAAQGHRAVLERHDGPSQSRRFLEGKGHPTASQERRPGRDGRRRLVRRRGPLRYFQDLSTDRETKHKDEQCARGWPVASRRVGLDAGREAGQYLVWLENG